MPAPNTTEIFPGLLDAAGFDRLARLHRRATGLALAAVDADGCFLRGAPGVAACARSEACRIFRAQAVAEALRWGEPCVLCCGCNRALWAVPVMSNQRLHGGLLVAGVALKRPSRAGSLDRRILGACNRLLTLATEANLTNAALLGERRHAARREREKAEALHTLKDRLHDDIRSIYLHEEPALLAAIRRGERTEARRIINRVLTAIYAVGQAHTELLKSLALELVVMMTRAAVQAGGDPAKILGLNYQSLTALAEVADQEALAVWLCDMLEQLIDAIEANTRLPNSVLLARALEFMETHLADDLSREQTARVAGLSPSHFSHLMRAKTGWSFTELLTRLRVDRACQLLVRTDAPLVQVALECGFGDQSYFSRVFRRRTAHTPGEYRHGPAADAPKSQTKAPPSNPAAPASARLRPVFSTPLRS
ncbi:MAG TPA: helix-turn-helix domain-containing protein [Opitutaceae bacterium]|jgi:AraC-like DNA-binding protein|nr:helix-turn-helix domain-containing protein [Opitutaceae bacterium]